MEPAPEALPDDIAALRALIVLERAERLRVDAEAARLQTEAAQLQHEVARLTALTERLDHIIAQLRRLQFGKRSEALDPDQLKLGLEDLESAAAEVEAEEETGRRGAEGRADPAAAPGSAVAARSPAARGGGDRAREQDLPLLCGAAAPDRRGRRAAARRLPAQYRILVTRRPKYACRGCEGTVVQAPAPPRLIEGGLPTERLVAHVLVAKYADHCPLYRQAQVFARQGIELDRSTLAYWVGYAAAELKPLWRSLREDLLRSGRLFVDETRARCSIRGGAHQDRLLLGDRPRRRGWGGSDPPAVAYSYAPGRGAEHAIALLAGFCGDPADRRLWRLQAAGAADRARGAIALAHCWAHVRRQFYELAKGGAAPIADEALRRIASSMPSRPRSAARMPTPARPRARRGAGRWSDLKLWLEARLTDRRGPLPDRRGDPLHPQPLGRASPASSTMAASRSTRTRSSGRSGRSR